MSDAGFDKKSLSYLSKTRVGGKEKALSQGNLLCQFRLIEGNDEGLHGLLRKLNRT